MHIPIANPARTIDGIASHHLLPSFAAIKPRTHDIQAQAKPIGPRQSENGGMNTLRSKSALGIPSFVDRVMSDLVRHYPPWYVVINVTGCGILKRTTANALYLAFVASATFFAFSASSVHGGTTPFTRASAIP